MTTGKNNFTYHPNKSMKRSHTIHISVYIILLLSILNVKAQDFLPKEAPTPNAASLGKFGDIPISYPNGNIALSIPIYTISSRGLEMPIFLSYSAAGVNLNTLPSWTGENWVLNAGGVITRQVNGEPDEWICPSELTYHNQVHNYFESYNIIPNMVKTNNYQGLIDDELFAAEEEAYKFGLKRHDYQPDIFTFNVMGKSGKFYLDNEGIWRVACDDNMEVIYDVKNEQLVSPFIEKKLVVTPCQKLYPALGYVMTRDIRINLDMTLMQ